MIRMLVNSHESWLSSEIGDDGGLVDVFEDVRRIHKEANRPASSHREKDVKL